MNVLITYGDGSEDDRYIVQMCLSVPSEEWVIEKFGQYKNLRLAFANWFEVKERQQPNADLKSLECASIVCYDLRGEIIGILSFEQWLLSNFKAEVSEIEINEFNITGQSDSCVN